MTTTLDSSFDRTARALCWTAVLLGLAINVVVWLQPRGAALSDGNAFRQYQTAMTARYLIKDGFQLDYETPVLGPPWSIPMEFPVYQACVAATVKVTGMSLLSAGHLVSMGFFWAGLPAVWLLLGRLGTTRQSRQLVLGLLLTCPVYLFYGRHFMIETTALCFGLWFLWSFHRALAPGGAAFGLLAVLFGALAGLAKVTTFFNFGFAAALVMAAAIRTRPRQWLTLMLWSGLLVGVPLAASYWWVRHSDALKEAHPIAPFLVSSHLRAFNFGTLAQRLRFETWQRFYGMLREQIVCETALVLGLFGVLLMPAARRWLIGACLLCYFASLLVFVNLYYVHDYYFVANAAFVIVAVALALEGVLTSPRLPPVVRSVAFAAVLALQVATFWRYYGFFFTREPTASSGMSTLIDRLTDPDDVVVVIGLDWHSRMLYDSNRRGIMLPGGYEYNTNVLYASLDRLGPTRVGAFIVAGNFKDYPHSIVPSARKMGVSLQPIAEGEGMQLYVRKDRIAEMAPRLAGFLSKTIAVNFHYDASKDPQSNMVDDDLTRPFWKGRFTMTSPAPSRLVALFTITLPETNGTAVIATHAPNTIFFPIPAGARHFQATYGMFEGAYTGKDFTDGVVVEVWEQLPDGNQIRHYQHTLLPHDRPEDRGDQKIELNLDRELVGQMFLKVEPGPAGSINYDWVYWRTVKIY